MESNNGINGIRYDALLERSFSYCNESIKTIMLQCRRLQIIEPEDSTFLFRPWADLRFLILSLDRLEKSVKIARKIPSIASEIDVALKIFHNSLPMLKKLRNVGEHFDAYALDSGNDKNVDRRQLQVGTWNGVTLEWLNEKFNIIDAKNASVELFITIQAIKNKFFHK